MLSLVFFGGFVSRLAYGWISDRIGGLRTLVLGSVGQAVTIACFLPVDGLIELYVVCALFGLSQGGIVPSYALIVRRYFRAGEGRLAPWLDHAVHHARDGVRRVACRRAVRLDRQLLHRVHGPRSRSTC